MSVVSAFLSCYSFSHLIMPNLSIPATSCSCSSGLSHGPVGKDGCENAFSTEFVTMYPPVNTKIQKLQSKLLYGLGYHQFLIQSMPCYTLIMDSPTNKLLLGKSLHKLFEFGVVLKGLNGIFEVV